MMATVTYYAAVLPFVLNEDGDLCFDEAIECTAPSAAESKAQALAATKAGAVAFARTGDPESSDFADATVLCKVGSSVPDDLEVAAGAAW